MILDGSHRKWCVATLALFLPATAGYVVYALNSPGGPRGGSIAGLLYGIAGSALMIFAGLISLRKKVPTWPIGSAQTWLRGHIWLGLLSLPLILFHAGFRWGGPLEQVLLVVMATVIISGLIDLGVQQFFPRQMTARVPLETFYAQIPYECRLLQLEGDVAVSTVCGPLPLDADESVATPSRLKLLGVAGRQPLPLVYRLPEGKNGHAETAPHAAKPAAKASSPGGPTGEVSSSEQKPLSAAEKIAAMRAAKEPAAEIQPAEDAAGPAQTAEKSPAAKLSAAEKIAMMRAGKKPSGAPAEAGEQSPTPAAAAATEESPQAAPAAEQHRPGGEKPPLSAAEKIALMRSLKHTSKPASSETPAPVTSEAAAGASTAEAPAPSKLTAADKIAMMRAGKKPEHPSPPGAASSPTAATAAAETEAKKPLSAADKIAMMRAKGKPATAPPEKATSEAAPAAAAPAKKPATAKKPPVEKPIDPAAQKRAAEGLEKFYLESVRPFLDYGSRARGALASEVNAGGIFAVVGTGLTEEMRPVLDRLLGLCEKRRQISVQERIHGAMHFWLFIHVPLSLALLGLGVAHAIMSVYY